jgi:hypothetical protein
VGYTRANTHVVCFLCNSRKSNLTVAELADGNARSDRGPSWRAWALAYLGRKPSIDKLRDIAAGADAPKPKKKKKGCSVCGLTKGHDADKHMRTSRK